MRVRFLPHTRVVSDFPAHAGQLRVQRQRWAAAGDHAGLLSPLRMLDDLVLGHAEYRRVINAEIHFRRCFSEVFRQRSLLFLGHRLLKLPGQRVGFSYDRHFDTVVSRRLITAILDGSLTDPARIGDAIVDVRPSP